MKIKRDDPTIPDKLKDKFFHLRSELEEQLFQQNWDAAENTVANLKKLSLEITNSLHNNGERFIEKANLIRVNNLSQYYQGESGEWFILSGSQRNPDVKIGQTVDIFYRSTSNYGLHFARKRVNNK
ncbi:hypothetical protein M2277_005056 [Paenibacillus sp. LBL]|uniref:hypothetical protein n=1 Tax=Paenibacillus sp. LBL TaxID=2940563 RepID=UPI0024772400|nr:hypothetical protein [Paenibacillus sp. LBL]MDH6674364.1 hypothetical protein [Paenibacillus sp. LBL]